MKSALLRAVFTKIAQIFATSDVYYICYGIRKIMSFNAGLFQRVWLRQNSRTWRCIKSWIKRSRSSTACEQTREEEIHEESTSQNFCCQPFQQCFMFSLSSVFVFFML